MGISGQSIRLKIRFPADAAAEKDWMKGPADPITNEASRIRKTIAQTVPALPVEELSLTIFEPCQNASAFAAYLQDLACDMIQVC